MERKIVIGIDFDDVLVETNEAMSAWHNRVYGTSYKKEHIISWEHLTHLWQCSQNEKHKRIHEFFHSEDHLHIPAVLGASEALKILNEKGMHTVVITGRPEQFCKQTLSLVEKYFPSLVDHIHFSSSIINGSLSERPKAEFCRELDVEIFIDDHLQYVQGVVFAGIPALLFNTPWNQTETLPPNVERVYGWDEIVQKLV
ncbi:MAG: HAD hydrolase-like protein [bacterium]|nr:HAD hydrolase-like protein [bacterium]